MTEYSDLVSGFANAFSEFYSELDRRQYADSRSLLNQRRVQSLIEEMNEYERLEMQRENAVAAFKNGNLSCIDETVVKPTPEQLSKGRFERFTADTVEGTAVSATTCRRVLLFFVRKFYEDGVIEQNEFEACKWYRDVHESTGLAGNIPSTDFGKEIFSAPQSRSMFTDWQIDMQDMFRIVRSQMNAKYLPFFDAIVLHDHSPRNALELAKKRNGTEKALFRDIAGELASAYDMLKS